VQSVLADRLTPRQGGLDAVAQLAAATSALA
jgi:hypothetical protein